MQRRSVTDSRAEVQLVQTGRYGKKEAEALVGSVTRYPLTRHSDRRIVMDAYQVMDYKEEKEEEEEDPQFYALKEVERRGWTIIPHAI